MDYHKHIMSARKFSIKFDFHNLATWLQVHLSMKIMIVELHCKLSSKTVV